MTGNPFEAGRVAAANYARARPYYHPEALALAFETIGRDRVDVGLDVGSGTGLSTKALLGRAARVVGVEPSDSMLSACAALPGAVFVQASAEKLPVRTASADVVTCAATMHWFPDSAFAELARVTRDGGHVVVYCDFFLGELTDHPQFRDWLREAYLPRFPSPRRRSHYNDEAMTGAGFTLATRDERTRTVAMSRQGLVDYLMTQSNATTATMDGRAGFEELRTWLMAALADLVADEVEARFSFRVWVASKTASHHPGR